MILSFAWRCPADRERITERLAEGKARTYQSAVRRMEEECCQERWLRTIRQSACAEAIFRPEADRYLGSKRPAGQERWRQQYVRAVIVSIQRQMTDQIRALADPAAAREPVILAVADRPGDVEPAERLLAGTEIWRAEREWLQNEFAWVRAREGR